MPTTRSAIPPALFTHSIQRPLFGSETEVAAMTQKRTPMPSAKVNSMAEPRTTLPSIATQPSMPARNGPVQGAAVKPPTIPIAKAPP